MPVRMAPRATAEGMAVARALWASDPLAAAVGEGREAISRRSRFEAHKRAAALHAADEADVQITGRCGEGLRCQRDAHTRRSQSVDAGAVDGQVGSPAR